MQWLYEVYIECIGGDWLGYCDYIQYLAGLVAGIGSIIMLMEYTRPCTECSNPVYLEVGYTQCRDDGSVAHEECLQQSGKDYGQIERLSVNDDLEFIAVTHLERIGFYD